MRVGNLADADDRRYVALTEENNKYENSVASCGRDYRRELSNQLPFAINQNNRIMKRTIAVKYIIVLMCIMFGSLAILYTPDLYKLSDLNLGPSIAFAFAVCGTLVWDSVND